MSAIARPAAPPATTELIDAYVAAITRSLDRSLADLALGEPHLQHIERAAKLIAPLAETLAGLALGSVVGAIVSGVRRSMNREIATTVTATLARRIQHYEPRRIPAFTLLDESPARTFGGELVRRVRARIALVLRDARPLLTAVAEEVAHAGHMELRALNRLLAAATTDAVIAERYAAEVSAGWRAYLAVLAGTPAETSALWQLWSREVRGEREVLTPTPAELVADGYISRIG